MTANMSINIFKPARGVPGKGRYFMNSKQKARKTRRTPLSVLCHKFELKRFGRRVKNDDLILCLFYDDKRGQHKVLLDLQENFDILDADIKSLFINPKLISVVGSEFENFFKSIYRGGGLLCALVVLFIVIM